MENENELLEFINIIYNNHIKKAENTNKIEYENKIKKAMRKLYDELEYLKYSKIDSKHFNRELVNLKASIKTLQKYSNMPLNEIIKLPSSLINIYRDFDFELRINTIDTTASLISHNKLQEIIDDVFKDTYKQVFGKSRKALGFRVIFKTIIGKFEKMKK